MRVIKSVLAFVITLSIVWLVILIVNPPIEESSRNNQQPLSSADTDQRLACPVDMDLSLRPDRDANRVSVIGLISGTEDLLQHVQSVVTITDTWSTTCRGGYPGTFFVGQWNDGRILTTSNDLDAPYRLQLPGLNLQPTDTLRIILDSGPHPSQIFSARTAPEVMMVSVAQPVVTTGTLAVGLAFTPTSALTATAGALTGSYALDNPAFSPVSGPFAVTATVALTTNYTLSTTAVTTPTEILQTTDYLTSAFRSAFRRFPNFSQIDLTDFTTRPITLLLEVYPYQKNINLWLMPDFANNRVWADGEIYGLDDREQQLAQVRSVISITAAWPITSSGDYRGTHLFGQWIGGQILTTSNDLDAPYRLHLPGLDLQPKDNLRIKLVSGLILSQTVEAQVAPEMTATSVLSPAVSTGTLTLRLTFTPTSTLTATADALTGSYSLDDPAFSPASGTFAVTSTVALTAKYSITPSAISASATMAVMSPGYSSTFEQFGDFSQIDLTNFETRPITLWVDFYPYQKDINLSLTPLLVETTMTRTASAYGGERVYNFPSTRAATDTLKLPYVHAGLKGSGALQLHVTTVTSDAQRSAVALAQAFRQTAEDRKDAQPNRLLERTFDFPSFPFDYSIQQLNRHKETLIQVKAISSSVLTGDAGFSLDSAFQINAWRRWYREGELPIITPTVELTPTLDLAVCGKDQPNYAYAKIGDHVAGYPDFNRCLGGIGKQAVMQLGLGRIMLGPRDVFTLTMKDVDWIAINPQPNALIDQWAPGSNGPERNGFTAVYSGAHAIDLNVLYNPRPSLFASQAVALLRGKSREIEFALSHLNEQGKPPEGVLGGVLLVLCLGVCALYQWCLNPKQSQRGKGWRVLLMILRSVLVASYLLAMLIFTHAYKLKTLPFEVLIAAGALLLFRWDKVFFRRGLYLLVIVSVAVGLDYQLNTTYLENVLNELQYSTATGLLSGGTAIAILVALAGCLLVIFWPLNNPARRYRLRHTDLSAFVFAGLAVATFDVQDASFFALLALYIAWLIFSVALDLLGPKLKLSPNDGSNSQTASEADNVGWFVPMGLLILIGLFSAQQSWGPQINQPDWNYIQFGLQAIAVISFLVFVVVLIRDYIGQRPNHVTAPTPPSVEATPAGGAVPAASATLVVSARPSSDTPPAIQNAPQEKGARVGLAELAALPLIYAAALIKGRSEPQQTRAIAATPPPVEAAPAVNPQPNEEVQTTSAPSQSGAAVNPADPKNPLTERLRWFLQPVPIVTVLIVAIILTQDRLLRAQLVSFDQSRVFGLAFLLDPLALLAMTLVPAVAVALLMVLLDTALEHWHLYAQQPPPKYRAFDVLIKILLPLTLFAVFLLGSGGWDLFTGATNLKLSDRIVYYVTVPLLTVLWLNWKPDTEADKGSLRKWLPAFLGGLTGWQQLFRLILIVLSILIPQLATSVSSEQFNQIIQTLQSLQGLTGG